MRILRLDNRTRWSSKDLRRFFEAGLKKLRCGPRTVRIRYGIGRALHGWAYYDSRILQICLPGPTYVAACQGKRKEPLDYKELAQTFEHEIDHTKGLTHSQMPDWKKLKPTWHKGLRIRWVEETFGLRVAKTRLRRAEKRFREASSARRRWKRAVRELEKRKKRKGKRRSRSN